nr:MAG TPA: protein of unknown function (DUF5310) [Caudoviricetes sp.]
MGCVMMSHSPKRLQRNGATNRDIKTCLYKGRSGRSFIGIFPNFRKIFAF